MMSSLTMLGWLWPALIVIGLVLMAGGAVALVRRAADPASPPMARQLLDARYARGEIDDAEYEHRREQLR
jgi:putative membrane protein